VLTASCAACLLPSFASDPSQPKARSMRHTKPLIQFPRPTAIAPRNLARWRKARSLLILCLAAVLSVFSIDASNAQVKENSVEGQNIMAAVRFIRSMGMDEAADQIQKALRDGDIYQDNLSGGDLGKTSPATKNITIDNSVLGKGDIGTQLFSSKFHFGQIFHLAMVLYHENVHRNQGLSIRIRSVIGKEPDEYQAWTRTLAATTEWIDTLWRQYRKLGKSDSTEDKEARTSAAKQLESATTFLSSEASSFVDEHKASGYDLERWKKFQKIAGELRGLVIEVSRAESQGKTVSLEQREKISETVSDALKAEKAVIGDLPKPARKHAAQPPTRISERPRKAVHHAPATTRARLSGSSPLAAGGKCPGAVSGATLKQRDRDANVIFALARECIAWNGAGR
jgi:hypothetical protein